LKINGADQITFLPGVNEIVESPATSSLSSSPCNEYSNILIFPIVDTPSLTHLISINKGSNESTIGKLSMFLLRSNHSVQELPSLDTR
jgi:hypothetical protein